VLSCSEEFELKPGKPGFAKPVSSLQRAGNADSKMKRGGDADERKTTKEANEARREAMRNLLYRKDS